MWRAAGIYYGTGGIPCFDQYLGGRRDCASANRRRRRAAQIRPARPICNWTCAATIRSGTDRFRWLTIRPAAAFGDDQRIRQDQQLIGYAGLNCGHPIIPLTNRLAAQYTDSETREYDPDAPANLRRSQTETFYGFGRNIREEYQGTWQFSPDVRLVVSEPSTSTPPSPPTVRLSTFTPSRWRKRSTSTAAMCRDNTKC